MTLQNDKPDAIPPAEELSFLQRVLRYQDSTMSAEELQAFEAELLQSAAKLRLFADIQLQSADIHGLLRRQAYVVDSPSPLTSSATSSPAAKQTPALHWGRWLVAAVVLIVVVAGLWQKQNDLPIAHHEAMPSPPISPAMTVPPTNPAGVPSVSTAVMPEAGAGPGEPQLNVRLQGASQARFFGELAPKVKSLLARNRDYVLTSGLVELAFPSGASAIIEGPAVFRVMTDDCLALDTGRCSVHAPDGAEGFRVETPVTRVVDRGTRFTVKVTEGVDTEVHVVEGIADVYWKSETAAHKPQSVVPSPELPLQMRLEERDARRFSGTEVAAAVPVNFTALGYRAQLPDRIISYEASLDASGFAEELLSVTVERGGISKKFPVEELIPAELIAFKSYPGVADRCGHLSGPGMLPEPRSNWLGDTSLHTGVINPGGETQPLTSNPVMNPVEDPAHPNTPGFAVRFQTPVINGPGPDVVFFELQTYANPPDGDAFHVSPLIFRPGLRSRTIRIYDLTLTSREVLPLGNFYLYKFATPIDTLSDLEDVACVRTQMRLGFRVLAVGIDLSELGFAPDEAVEGLFFQDANDDESHVDPVLISGLPAPAPAGRND